MAEKSVTIKIIGDAKSAQTAFNSVEVSAGKAETSLSKIGTTAAGFAVGGALTQLPGLLLDGAKGAAEDEAAMARLKTAVENTGKSYDTQSKTIDEAIKRGQEMAFTDGETADALATLTSLTGDSDEALRRLTSAQDLARGAGISLEQAAKLLGKTSDENTSALGRLGIQVGENATAQDVLNAVDEKFKGQAGTYADTAAGQMLIAQQNAGELAETFGGMLIPLLTLVSGAMLALSGVIQTNVAPAVQGFITYLAGFQPIVEPVISFIQENLTAVLVGLAAMLLTVVVPAFVAWAASAATAAAATVVALAPVIAIMAAVGLAAGALYLAWDTNFLGIRDIITGFIDWVSPYISTAMDALATAFQVALDAVLAVWNSVFPVLQSVAETVFPIIAQVVTTYIGILRFEIETALSIIQTVWNTVFPAIQAVVETVFPIIASIVSTQIEVMRTAIDVGVNAAKAIFDNVFVPIQGIVENVFNTIAGIVETVWGPAVSAIGTGVDTAKGFFDATFVGIQGIVDDVFSTISGLVDTLWNGASGAVGKIGSGVDTIKGFFSGIYDTMYGFGSDIVQGLIDGVTGLYGTFKSKIDDITNLLKIDVPGFSPPYDAGYEQGQRFMQGLTDGVEDGMGPFGRATGDVADGMDLGVGDRTPGGGGTGAGDRTPGGGAQPGDFYGHTPGGATGGGGGSVSPLPPVIGEPASGTIPLSGHFDNPQGGGGHSMGRGAAAVAAAASGDGASPFGSSPSFSGGSDSGLAALTAGNRFVGCSWQLTGMLTREGGRNNDWALFERPDGSRYWVSTKFCRDGRTGPDKQDYHQAARRAAIAEGRLASAGTKTPLSTGVVGGSGGTGALSGAGPQISAAGGVRADLQAVKQAVSDGMVDGWRRIQNGGRMTTGLVGN